MKKEDKKRDPIPPPDATPEEIGEFWDTHDLTDYWDETQEVEIQVDLKSDQNQTQSAETKPDLPAITEDAANATLDVVTDLALDAAIPAPIRGNVLKAFDRFCSALIDVPVGALERRSAEKRAESEARIKIREEITSQIVHQVQVDPEYALKAGHKFAEKIIGEQLNLDEIFSIAVSELKKAESDSSVNQGTSESEKEEPENSPDQDVNNNEETTINEDWLNNFETQARQVSTEEMQRRFGRVLAGEIEKPGSYSIRTLKTLGELDRYIATLFKNLCSVSVVLENLNSNYIFDVRVPSLGGDPGFNVLEKYGLSYRELNSLHEYGLIIQEYDSVFSYDIHTGTKDDSIPQRFRHQERYWNLLPSPEWDSNQEFFDLSGVVFSHVGCELLRIVDQDPVPEYTEDLKKYFASQKLQMLEVQNQ